MKVVVVGSGGYIGRRLCARLAAQGDQVVALSSSGPGGIDARSGRLPTDFILPSDADAVVYLAQSPHATRGAGNRTHVLDVNCTGAVQAAAAAVAAGIPRFLFASTGNVYAPSFAPRAECDALRVDNWYSLSKVHAEQALELFRGELDVHLLRLFGVYGPHQHDRLVVRLVERVRSGKAITLAPPVGTKGSIDGLRLSLAYVDDIVDCFTRIARDGGPEVVNIAGQDTLSLREIALAIGAQLDREPRFELIENAREGDLVADTKRLEAHLGALPTRFATGIAAMVEGGGSSA